MRSDGTSPVKKLLPCTSNLLSCGFVETLEALRYPTIEFTPYIVNCWSHVFVVRLKLPPVNPTTLSLKIFNLGKFAMFGASPLRFKILSKVIFSNPVKLLNVDGNEFCQFPFDDDIVVTLPPDVSIYDQSPIVVGVKSPENAQLFLAFQ